MTGNGALTNPLTLPWVKGGSPAGYGYIKDFRDVFIDNADPECPVTTCQILAADCTSAVPAYQYVNFGGSFPGLTVDADDYNGSGAVYDFCFSCTITPTDPLVSPMNINKVIKIVQLSICEK